MLFLSNSKGKDATSLVEDIFVSDVLNGASCLQQMLTTLRRHEVSSVHVYKTKSISLELLAAAEGLAVSVDTRTPELTDSLFKKHHVLDLICASKISNPDALMFNDLAYLNEQLQEQKVLRQLQNAQLVLVVDPNRCWSEWISLKNNTYIQHNFTLRSQHFGFFTLLTNRGKLGRWLGRIDQSFIQHLIPNRLKRGIYIELSHGGTT